MNILVAASEAVPFAKTGGLADVAGALPGALADLGHRAALILPLYRQARKSGVPIEPTGKELCIPIASRDVHGEICRAELPGSDIPVYLIDQPEYFDRDELYRSKGKDYRDNCERFVFFSRAVLETIRLLDLEVDCIHANDWSRGCCVKIPPRAS